MSVCSVKNLLTMLAKHYPFFMLSRVVTLFLVSIITANYSSLMHGCRIVKKSLTTTLQELCNEPTHIIENQICVLERFVIFVYFPKTNYTENINLERMNTFTATRNCNPRLLPFLNLVCWNKLSERLFRAAGYGKREKKCYAARSSIMGVGK